MSQNLSTKLTTPPGKEFFFNSYFYFICLSILYVCMYFACVYLQKPEKEHLTR